MKNKLMIGATVTMILLSIAVLLWYYNSSDISIVSLEAPEELVIYDVNYLNVSIQNNASEDVNVTINVKNSFMDERGETLKDVQILVYENSSYKLSNIGENPQKEVLLKPGINSIMVMVGYQMAGIQKVEVEIYQYEKLIDSRTIEINVLPAKIALKVRTYKGFNGTDEIHAVYGYLEYSGKESASDVVVNISVSDEITNATISTFSKNYTISSHADMRKAGRTNENLVVLSNLNITDDPVTGMRTTTTTETIAPVIVIELSKDEPSNEKYIMSPIVVKGKQGDRYKVVLTAMWKDQKVISEVSIPPLFI